KIPATPGFDIHAMDTAADPCVDFYQYACGSWNTKNPIPPDRSSWGRFDELFERNQIILRGILEKYSAADPKRSPLEQKIGDYYVKDDAWSVEIRRQYLAHVQRMFVLLGESAERAAADAQIVMDIETALARASLDVVSRRDPARVYHKLRVAELAYTLTASFN